MVVKGILVLFLLFSAFSVAFAEENASLTLAIKENHVVLNFSSSTDLGSLYFRRAGPFLILVVSEDGEIVPDTFWLKIHHRPNSQINTRSFYAPASQKPTAFNLDLFYGSDRFKLKDNTSYFSVVFLKKELGRFSLSPTNVLFFKIGNGKIISSESRHFGELPAKVSTSIQNELKQVKGEETNQPVTDFNRDSFPELVFGGR
jgi:hypothetical protein